MHKLSEEQWNTIHKDAMTQKRMGDFARYAIGATVDLASDKEWDIISEHPYNDALLAVTENGVRYLFFDDLEGVVFETDAPSAYTFLMPEEEINIQEQSASDVFRTLQRSIQEPALREELTAAVNSYFEIEEIDQHHKQGAECGQTHEKCKAKAYESASLYFLRKANYSSQFRDLELALMAARLAFEKRSKLSLPEDPAQFMYHMLHLAALGVTSGQVAEAAGYVDIILPSHMANLDEYGRTSSRRGVFVGIFKLWIDIFTAKTIINIGTEEKPVVEISQLLQRWADLQVEIGAAKQLMSLYPAKEGPVTFEYLLQTLTGATNCFVLGIKSKHGSEVALHNMADLFQASWTTAKLLKQDDLSMMLVMMAQASSKLLAESKSLFS